jgi:hypothetical protein
MRVFCTILALTTPFAAWAGSPEILGVRAVQQADGWHFDVTLRHADTGWDHYADAWVVLGPDGAMLGERVLAHPHVAEQPFTRSLSGVQIPEGVTRVRLRAHDSVHGYGPELSVDLPAPGEG